MDPAEILRIWRGEERPVLRRALEAAAGKLHEHGNLREEGEKSEAKRRRRGRGEKKGEGGWKEGSGGGSSDGSGEVAPWPAAG